MVRTETRRRSISEGAASTLTPDQKVDEASIESMDGSDPPGYLPMRVGAPRDRQGAAQPDEALGPLVREIWQPAGRRRRLRAK